MNLITSKIFTMIEAKICGCGNTEKSVSYNFAEPSYIQCLDNREIMQLQIHACESLLKDLNEEVDNLVVKSEIVELTLALAAMKSNKNSKHAYCSLEGCKNHAITLCSICFNFYSCSYKHAYLHKHPMEEFEVF